MRLERRKAIAAGRLEKGAGSSTSKRTGEALSWTTAKTPHRVVALVRKTSEKNTERDKAFLKVLYSKILKERT